MCMFFSTSRDIFWCQVVPLYPLEGPPPLRPEFQRASYGTMELGGVSSLTYKDRSSGPICQQTLEFGTELLKPRASGPWIVHLTRRNCALDHHQTHGQLTRAIQNFARSSVLWRRRIARRS